MDIHEQLYYGDNDACQITSPDVPCQERLVTTD